MGRLLSILLILVVSTTVMAQNISFSAGNMTVNDDNQQSMAWQIEYEYNWSQAISTSLAYLNEGHIIGHKRDGFILQGRIFAPIKSDKFLLSFGVGPYKWYDTQYGQINNGWAIAYSVITRYNISKDIFVKTTWDRIQSNDHRDSDAFLIGAGIPLELDIGRRF